MSDTIRGPDSALGEEWNRGNLTEWGSLQGKKEDPFAPTMEEKSPNKSTRRYCIVECNVYTVRDTIISDPRCDYWATGVNNVSMHTTVAY